MCHERYLRRRREGEEGREIWQDFWRTWWVDEPQSPAEPATEPEPDEVREAVATPER